MESWHPWPSRQKPAPARRVAPGSTGNRISARIAAVSPSATLAVDAKAKALQAQGESVIGFGAGEPDFPTPDTIVAAAEAACRDPRNHRYTPTAGLPELREAIAAKTGRDSGLEVAAAQVLVTNGGKQAVANTVRRAVRPGRRGPGARAVLDDLPRGRSPWPAACPWWCRPTRPRGFRVTVDQLEAARTPATKVLLFVSPSNPTGAVYPREEIEAIGRWAAEHGIWVVTDEIYEHLVYGGAEHHSMPVVVPELADRCIVVNGVAKTYAMTGWRVGWMVGPTDVVAAATNLQSHETSNVANVSQRAALAAVSGDLSAVAMMREAFDRRRLTIHRMLNEIDGVECLLPEGAFYAFPSVSGLYGRELRGRTCSSAPSWPSWPSRRPRWRWCPARRSARPGTSGCPTPWATTTWSRASRRLADLFGGG